MNAGPSDSSTSNPQSARAHARSMGGTRVDAMPTVPATSTAALPAGVSSESMLWEETLGPGGYASKELHRGARLRLTDLGGDACVSMLIFNAERPVERLNVADTVKVQWNAYLGAGCLLLSDMGRVLMSVLEDTAESHDAFCGTSNARTNLERYGSGANHGPCPNGRDRLLLGAAKFGLGPKDVHPCVNWFKGVRIGDDGSIALNAGRYLPNRVVTLRAEMHVIVALANCPHVLDERRAYTVGPVRVAAWRGPVAASDDPIRTASPEGGRAFLNVEEYLRR